MFYGLNDESISWENNEQINEISRSAAKQCWILYVCCGCDSILLIDLLFQTFSKWKFQTFALPSVSAVMIFIISDEFVVASQRSVAPSNLTITYLHTCKHSQQESEDFHFCEHTV